MADNHSTGNNRPIKTLKDNQAASPPCQTCGIITKTMDTTALAQSGFSDLGALCQAIRSACDKHTNPYYLAGIEPDTNQEPDKRTRAPEKGTRDTRETPAPEKTPTLKSFRKFSTST